ncbi:hypothetical protein [Rathayibacter soli]|uniref:hypothetical protein n=1 Tax=Rathayibacter soli TaxID=3144168 RepID=UPI0027E4F591|nr:hypothetical protein [Glaciibacter superstes]
MNTDENRHGESGHQADLPAGEAAAATAKLQVPALARYHDPSVARPATGQPARHSNQHGVAWVRPSELLAQAGSRVAGRGIDFHAELARRTRRLPADAATTTRRVISARAHRLPPASAFGRTSTSPQGAARSSIGLQ